MQTKASSFFPPRDLWLPIVPLLPLIALMLLLQFLTNFVLSATETEAATKYLEFLDFPYLKEYLSKPSIEYIHIGDILAYNAFVSLHVFICIFVVFYFLYLIAQLPPEERSKSIAFLFLISASLVILVGTMYLLQDDIVLVMLGFKAVCIAIEGAGLATQLVDLEGCFVEDSVGKLTWLALVPTFFGMGAVAVAAAFSYGNAAGLPSLDDPDWRANFERRIKSLQRSVYALSAVLISSTITISLFAGLPKNLFKNESAELAKAVGEYVSGLSTFWGVLFSLTLAATFAAPAFRILHHAYGSKGATGGTADLRAWLNEHVFVSAKKQIGNVLVLLGPLLAGSLNSIFSFLAGK